MEESWIQRFRNVAKQQAASIIDAKIVGHRMELKRLDGQVIDAGPIKVKPAGTLVYLANYPDATEPDIYVTKDGAIWVGGASQARFQDGTSMYPNGACWTGDRFMVPLYVFDDYSTMLQSKDGGTWAFHPDREMFNIFTNGSIYGMDASGTGVVVLVGASLGAGHDDVIAVSHDFGDTWTVLDNSILPFGSGLQSVCVKNEFEWVVHDGFYAWYTFDGGGRWGQIVYPTELTLSAYGSAVKYFNGYWWFYGQGTAETDWNTPLIKSADLVNWTPVIVPWSGNYPPLVAYNPFAPDEPSGEIRVLEYDHLTNTVMANGNNPTNRSVVLMSDNGGDHWFEIGYLEDDHWRTDNGWDGVYKWNGYDFFEGGGIAYAYDWWFMVDGQPPGGSDPPMIRISPSGQTTEPVYPAHLVNMSGVILLAGGDITF